MGHGRSTLAGVGAGPMITKSFWHNKRVALTGHTGFKGSWMALWLLERGAHVLGFSLPPPSTPSLFEKAKIASEIKSIEGDVRDLPRLQKSFAEFSPEIVIHMAAQSLVRPSYQDPVGTYATNVMGTVNVLEASRTLPSLQTVLIITTDKVYENREWPWPYRENDPLGGKDPYSSSKACAEIITSAYRSSFFAKDSAVSVISARAGNVIGGGDWATDRLIPDCVRAFSKNEPITLRNPRAIRPWQHVLDPLSGYLKLIETAARQPKEMAKAWNLATPVTEAKPVGAVVETVCQLWGDGASLRTEESTHNPHEAQLLTLDSTQAITQLGWRCQLNLESALAWTVEWYKSELAGANARDLCLKQISKYMSLGEG